MASKNHLDSFPQDSALRTAFKGALGMFVAVSAYLGEARLIAALFAEAVLTLEISNGCFQSPTTMTLKGVEVFSRRAPWIAGLLLGFTIPGLISLAIGYVNMGGGSNDAAKTAFNWCTFFATAASLGLILATFGLSNGGESGFLLFLPGVFLAFFTGLIVSGKKHSRYGLGLLAFLCYMVFIVLALPLAGWMIRTKDLDTVLYVFLGGLCLPLLVGGGWLIARILIRQRRLHQSEIARLEEEKRIIISMIEKSIK